MVGPSAHINLPQPPRCQILPHPPPNVLDWLWYVWLWLFRADAAGLAPPLERLTPHSNPTQLRNRVSPTDKQGSKAKAPVRRHAPLLGEGETMVELGVDVDVYLLLANVYVLC